MSEQVEFFSAEKLFWTVVLINAIMRGMQKELTHEELLKKIATLNPLLIQAIAEVDVSLIEEFKKLPIEQKIARASSVANTLSGFAKR